MAIILAELSGDVSCVVFALYFGNKTVFGDNIGPFLVNIDIGGIIHQIDCVPSRRAAVHLKNEKLAIRASAQKFEMKKFGFDVEVFYYFTADIDGILGYIAHYKKAQILVVGNKVKSAIYRV